MARLGKAVDLIDEASSLVRGCQVISSDLVAKAKRQVLSTNKQVRGILCSLYFFLYGIFFASKNLGKIF